MCLQSPNLAFLIEQSLMGSDRRWLFCPEKTSNKMRHHVRQDLHPLQGVWADRRSHAPDLKRL